MVPIALKSRNSVLIKKLWNLQQTQPIVFDLDVLSMYVGMNQSKQNCKCLSLVVRPAMARTQKQKYSRWHTVRGRHFIVSNSVRNMPMTLHANSSTIFWTDVSQILLNDYLNDYRLSNYQMYLVMQKSTRTGLDFNNGFLVFATNLKAVQAVGLVGRYKSV
jgi:hypothetical protein